MRKSVLALLFLLGWATATAAQTKVSGTVQCAKPDTAYTLAAGDRPDHAFGLNRVRCTWTKPLEIAGLQTKEDELTGFSEVTGNSSTDRTYAVGTLSNGDKMFVRVQGKSMLKGGVPQSGAGTWAFAGGSGKLTGITGKGTFKCTSNPDGSSTCNVEGEYELAK